MNPWQACGIVCWDIQGYFDKSPIMCCCRLLHSILSTSNWRPVQGKEVAKMATELLKCEASQMLMMRKEEAVHRITRVFRYKSVCNWWVLLETSADTLLPSNMKHIFLMIAIVESNLHLHWHLRSLSWCLGLNIKDILFAPIFAFEKATKHSKTPRSVCRSVKDVSMPGPCLSVYLTLVLEIENDLHVFKYKLITCCSNKVWIWTRWNGFQSTQRP